MTAITGRRTHRSLIGLAVQLLHARAQSKGARGSRLAAAIQDHAMTICAMAAVDVGMFKVAVWAGWVGLGVVLLLTDFKVQA